MNRLRLVLNLSILMIGLLFGSAHAQQQQLEVLIDYPRSGAEVGMQQFVSGTASIGDGQHLWVLARRCDFAPLWWPQREAKIDAGTHQWKTTAYFGLERDIGWEFDVGVVVVDEAGHQRLMDYWINAMETANWTPIKIPDPLFSLKVVTVKKVKH